MPSLDQINKLIQINERRLAILEQQKATMGTQTPPHILIEIEDINAEMAKLHAQLNSLEGSILKTE